MADPRASARHGCGRYLAERSPLLVPLLVIGFGFWPGHLNADSLIQVAQARDDVPITDHYTPILVWLWDLFWPLGLRPGAMLILQNLTFAIGSYLILRIVLRPIWASTAAALVMLSPPVLGQLGLVGRDTWFIALLLLCFGLVAFAARDPRRQAWALAGAGAAGFLCLASRQNAAAAVAIAVIAAVFIVLGPSLRVRRRPTRIGAPIALGLALTLATVLLQLAAVRVAGTPQARPEQVLFLYDLAAFTRRDGVSAFPRSVYPSGAVAAIGATSSLDDIIPMISGEAAPFHYPLPDDQIDALREKWIDTVTSRPLDYLDIRFDAWLRQINLTAPPLVAYDPGIDPNPWGYHIEFDTANDVVTGYEDVFSGGGYLGLNGSIVHRAFIYLMLAGVVAIVLIRRGGAAAVVGALALSGWTYQAGILLGTMGSNYRYEFPVVAIAILATIVAVGLAVRERRGSATSPCAKGRRPVDAPARLEASGTQS
jgi:hypothetical protein